MALCHVLSVLNVMNRTQRQASLLLGGPTSLRNLAPLGPVANPQGDQQDRHSPSGHRVELRLGVSELSLRGGGERGLLTTCYTDTQQTLHNNLYCQKKLLCLLHPPSCRTREKGPWNPKHGRATQKGAQPSRKPHCKGSRCPPFHPEQVKIQAPVGFWENKKL